MIELSNIKVKIKDMSRAVLKMWQETFRTFMEHNPKLIPGILEQEDTVNNMEKEITLELIELIRSTSDKRQKADAAAYTDIIADLEIIGDYCKDILERIEIKIAERLMFSEEAFEEYKELYAVTEAALRDIVDAQVNNDIKLVERVLKKDKNVDEMVERFRDKHKERLVEGTCDPRGCNMFLNMLDFTAEVYSHIKNVARGLNKIGK